MYGGISPVQVYRSGQKAEVQKRVVASDNDFGNPETEYYPDRAVIAARTYPNRNTEVQNSAGDYHQDEAVFIVPIGPEQNEPPQEEDILVYDGQQYEVKAHTEYDTHVEFFGKQVIQDVVVQ